MFLTKDLPANDVLSGRGHDDGRRDVAGGVERGDAGVGVGHCRANRSDVLVNCA